MKGGIYIKRLRTVAQYIRLSPPQIYGARITTIALKNPAFSSNFKQKQRTGTFSMDPRITLF